MTITDVAFSARKAALRSGFTLIEMSIVLVIIGLIVGGVLVGQEMIKAATVRSEASELEKVETAVYTFRDKYSAFPGDMPNATTIFGTTDANGYTVANGNGNGNIASTISIGGSDTKCVTGPATEFHYGTVPNEVQEVFHHLNLAGMGNYNIAPPAFYAGVNPGHQTMTTLPSAVMGGGMLVSCLFDSAKPSQLSSYFTSGTAIMFGLVSNSSLAITDYSTRISYTAGESASTFVISPDIASRLDAKIDDGLPQTGNLGVLVTCSNAQAPSTYAAMASSCNVSMVKMLWQ